MNDNKFSTGFLLGLLIGGGAVFLLGTRTGKNLLKIVSEQGLDGLISTLEEYGLEKLEDMEEYEEVEEDEVPQTNGHAKKDILATSHIEPAVKEATPKKRFFKRVRRA
jgi:hypothetical protein